MTRRRRPRRSALAGHAQQLVVRELSGRPRGSATALAALSPRLRRDVRDDLAARRAFRSMHPTASSDLADELPAWRIVTPLPARRLRRFYREAERRYGVDWEYLAAINLVETAFGRIRGTSIAGAQGPMQFIPTTWDIYGAGGDIHDPHDAVLAAARLLRANGFARDRAGALRRYNNSAAYVRGVSLHAGVMQRRPRSCSATTPGRSTTSPAAAASGCGRGTPRAARSPSTATSSSTRRRCPTDRVSPPWLRAPRRPRPASAGCRTRCPPGRRGRPSRCPGRTARGGRPTSVAPSPRTRSTSSSREPDARAQVEVEAVLDRLGLGHLDEEDAVARLRVEDHALLVAGQVGVAVDVDVAEQPLPPLGELVGVGAVDGGVRDEGGHAPTVAGTHRRRQPDYRSRVGQSVPCARTNAMICSASSGRHTIRSGSEVSSSL